MATSKKSNEKVVDNRVRYYATVVYPESAVEGWLDIIQDKHIPCFISPLHDSDINPTGEPKKPHYHVIMLYENKKSRDSVIAFFKTFGGVGCEPVSSLRGYARYLCHLDNPEKAQYDVSDVKSLCGADYLDVIGLPTDRLKAIREMQQFCIDNEVIAFSDLLDFSAASKPDWYRVLCESGALIMREYIKSRYWKEHRKDPY